MGGDPFDPGIGSEHCLFYFANVHEPAGNGLVEQWGITPPAVRIVVRVLVALDERALRLEPGRNVLVRVLDEAARIVGHLGQEAAALVDRTDRGDAVLASGLRIVLAEARGDVHDPGPVLGTDEGGGHHPEAPSAFLSEK
jgi:hypothetical protein